MSLVSGNGGVTTTFQTFLCLSSISLQWHEMWHNVQCHCSQPTYTTAIHWDTAASVSFQFFSELHERRVRQIEPPRPIPDPRLGTGGCCTYAVYWECCRRHICVEIFGTEAAHRHLFDGFENLWVVRILLNFHDKYYACVKAKWSSRHTPQFEPSKCSVRLILDTC